MTNKEKIRSQYSWDDFKEIVEDNTENIDSLLSTAQQIKQKNFGNLIKVYIPGSKFPAISITGDKCELNCEHCNKKYLKGMKAITSKKGLEAFLMEHYTNDGVGVLISGGSLSDGSVPLIDYLGVIKKVKEKTDLIINTHTGLLNEPTAQKLAEAGIDIVSFDINMDREIIRDIYHLDKDLNDYKKAIELLKKYNLNIVPHICVGLHYGSLRKELESLKYIKESEINPALIVLIVLIPPKNSKGRFETPTSNAIAKIIAITRHMFPTTEISLGCMRPRNKSRDSIEMKALKGGITRIEMPSKKVLKTFKKEKPQTEFQFFSACCAVPVKFEKQIKMDNTEITRRYKNINKPNV